MLHIVDYTVFSRVFAPSHGRIRVYGGQHRVELLLCRVSLYTILVLLKYIIKYFILYTLLSLSLYTDKNFSALYFSKVSSAIEAR